MILSVINKTSCFTQAEFYCLHPLIDTVFCIYLILKKLAIHRYLPQYLSLQYAVLHALGINIAILYI